MDYASLIAQQRQRVSQAQSAYDRYSREAGRAHNELTAFKSNMKTGAQFYDAQHKRLDIAGAENAAGQQKRAMDTTQQMISHVPQAVSGRTSSSLVTESQRENQTQNELRPLTQQYQTVSEQYSQMSQGVSELRSEASKRTGMEYKTQQDRYGQLNNVWKQLIDQQKKQYKSLQNAQQLRDRYIEQKARVDRFNAQLAEQKRQFDAQMAQIRSQYASSINTRSSNYEASRKAMQQVMSAVKDPLGTLYNYALKPVLKAIF